MQISHYKTYATIFRNDFSNNRQDLRLYHEEATIVLRVPTRDIRIYDIIIVRLVLWYYFISSDFMFWLMFSAIMKVFCTFGDHNIVLTKSPFVSGRTSHLSRKTCGHHCIFPANYQSENWIADKRKYFLRYYSHSTNVYVLYKMDLKSIHA